jgi:hypothetical protein
MGTNTHSLIDINISGANTEAYIHTQTQDKDMQTHKQAKNKNRHPPMGTDPRTDTNVQTDTWRQAQGQK